MTYDDKYRVHEEALIKFFSKCDTAGYDFDMFLKVIDEKYFPEPSFKAQIERIQRGARERVKQLAEKEKNNGGTEEKRNVPID